MPDAVTGDCCKDAKESKMRSIYKYIPLLATTAVCIALYVIGACLYPGFATLRVFANFFSDNAFLGIIAVGMTLVIISGGIDLSVGSVMALCTVVMATLMRANVSPELAIVIALTIGSALGLVMGLIIHYS
jgi:simple sugar transport system permease protein